MGRKQRRTLSGQSFRQLERRQKTHNDGVARDVVCSLGKIPYRSRKAADRKMIKLRQAPTYKDRGYPLHTYECPLCCFWHVGHDTRNYEQRMTTPEPERFTVEAVEKKTVNGSYVVDYWRVIDAETGLRANGSAKYETRAQAQRWCDAFNR